MEEKQLSPQAIEQKCQVISESRDVYKFLSEIYTAREFKILRRVSILKKSIQPATKLLRRCIEVQRTEIQAREDNVFQRVSILKKSIQPASLSSFQPCI